MPRTPAAPKVGGKALRFNAKEIKALPGIIDAFVLEPNDDAGKASFSFMDGMAKLHGGVAIVGEDTWSVMDAKNRLQVEWDERNGSNDDWPMMIAKAQEIAAQETGEIKLDHADVDGAMTDPANQVVESFYQFPYVAHVCMEPMNCTADYRRGQNGEPDTLDVWLGSQFPEQVKEVAENLLGIGRDQVTVHNQRMGGGFGRRALHDYASEAMAISARIQQPVKLTWTRTDDIHNDFFSCRWL